MERNFNFYSQAGEDKWLYDNGYIQKRGVFLDIGSANAYTNSNTAFLHQFGWIGFCLDPNPTYAESYDSRPAVFRQWAVSNFTGKSGFYFCPEPELGKLEPTAPDEVECYTLKDVVDKLNLTKIDLLSIDVEGMEYEVFAPYFKSGGPLPKIIIFEYCTLGKVDDRLKVFLEMHTPYKRLTSTIYNHIYSL